MNDTTTMARPEETTGGGAGVEADAVMTDAELDAYLARQGVVGVIRLGELVKDFFDACVDGREDAQVIGMPGGDAALLVEIIAGIRAVYGVGLSQEQVTSVVRWYAQNFGTFYHHSDTHALEEIQKRLPSEWGITSAEGVEALIRMPQEEQKEQLLELLVNPEYMGCGHLKNMLKNPTAYGENPEDVRMVLRGFFEVLWDTESNEADKMNFRVLQGDHAEKGVLVMKTDVETMEEDTLLPTVAPQQGDTSVFVYHPQVVAFMQEAVATALVASRVIGELKLSNLPQLQAFLTKLEADNLQETLKRLASGKPVFERVWTQEQLGNLLGSN